MSPLAQFLDELVVAINAPAGQTALGGACTARRGYQETQPQQEQTTTAVWMAPEQWRTLGRCGGLRLEQHTIAVKLVRKQATPTTAVLDADIALAAALRTLLEEFQGVHGGRVVEVLGPLTIDKDKLTHPGQVSIGLLLDCEILTGTAAAEADPAEPGRLTVARNAVWAALELWPPLAAVFQRTYKTAGDFAELQLRDPVPAELPAIAVYWGDIAPEWKWHRTQDWPLTMRLAVWLPGDRHTYAETLIEQVFDALYQSTPEDSTRTYIEQATGYPPRRVSSLTVSSVVLGRAQQVHALRADVAFTLRSNKDPFGEESE